MCVVYASVSALLSPILHYALRESIYIQHSWVQTSLYKKQGSQGLGEAWGKALAGGRQGSGYAAGASKRQTQYDKPPTLAEKIRNFFDPRCTHTNALKYEHKLCRKHPTHNLKQILTCVHTDTHMCVCVKCLCTCVCTRERVTCMSI